MFRLGLGPLKSENRIYLNCKTFILVQKVEDFFANKLIMELQIIQNEYFELVVKLNRSNKLRNEKSSLSFKIIESKVEQDKHLYAVLAGGHKIALSKKRLTNFWIGTGFSGHFELEKFLTKLLNEKSIRYEGDYTELILERLFPKE